MEPSMQLLLLLSLLAQTNAFAATEAEHAACAAAVAPINDLNEIYQKDGFLFTMNRLQHGFNAHKINEEALPTLWIVIDGKTYIHNVLQAPITKGGSPDVHQDYRMEFDVPGKGTYCLEYRYRMGVDRMRSIESGACNPQKAGPEGQVRLGRVELQELPRKDDHSRASYMLQDLIEDNLRESTYHLESLIERLHRERQKKGPRVEELLDRIRTAMKPLHNFNWDICAPVAKVAYHHSVQKRMDALAKMYLLGALETKIASEEIPKDCLPQ